MKKLIWIALGCLLALTMQVNAAEGGKTKREPNEAQKKVMKELLEKYDSDKDGKLNKDERAKITAEDKEKLKTAAKAGQGTKKRQGERKGKKQ